MYFRRSAVLGAGDGTQATGEFRRPDLKGAAPAGGALVVPGSPAQPSWATDAFWGRHRLYIAGTACLHLASGATIFAISNDWPVRVCASYMTWAPENSAYDCFETYTAQNVTTVNVCRITNAHKFVGVISPIGLVFAFFMLSFAFQVAPTVSSGAWSAYRAWVESGVQPLRWFEYSVSASVMVILLLILNGNADLWLFIAAAAANWAVMMFGLVQEQLSYLRVAATAEPLSPRGVLAHASAHFLGWVPMVFIWTIIIAQFTWSLDAAGDRVPAAVHAIIWVQLVFFTSFGVNHLFGTLAHLYRWNHHWSALHSEVAYTVLSFVSKSLLAWLLFFGVAMRDPEKLVPLSMC